MAPKINKLAPIQNVAPKINYEVCPSLLFAFLHLAFCLHSIPGRHSPPSLDRKKQAGLLLISLKDSLLQDLPLSCLGCMLALLPSILEEANLHCDKTSLSFLGAYHPRKLCFYLRPGG